LSAVVGGRNVARVMKKYALAVAAAAVLALPASSGAASDCGHVKSGQASYNVERVHPDVTCAMARYVAGRYLRGGTAPSPWMCFRVHRPAPTQFAVQCAVGRRTMLRAYYIPVVESSLAARRDCGLTQRIAGVGFQVMIVRGSAPCASTKRMVYRYLREGRVAAPWSCHHTGLRSYFVACERGAAVKVHVYAPG